MKIVVGIIIIVAGLAMIIFREKLARDMIAFQNQTFGFHFGKRTVGLHTLLAVPFGILFIAVGFLVLTGVWQLKV